MKYKKIVLSIIILIAGIAMLIFAVRSMGTIADAKSQVQNMSQEMSNSMVGKRVSGSMMSSASQYDTQMKVGLYIGIGLIVIGGALTVFFFKKKKR